LEINKIAPAYFHKNPYILPFMAEYRDFVINGTKTVEMRW